MGEVQVLLSDVFSLFIFFLLEKMLLVCCEFPVRPFFFVFLAACLGLQKDHK